MRDRWFGRRSSHSLDVVAKLAAGSRLRSTCAALLRCGKPLPQGYRGRMPGNGTSTKRRLVGGAVPSPFSRRAARDAAAPSCIIKRAGVSPIDFVSGGEIRWK